MTDCNAHGPGFRQQAVATANLLLQAASILENDQSPHPSSDEGPSTSTGASNSLRSRLSLRDRGRIYSSQATSSRLRSLSVGSENDDFAEFEPRSRAFGPSGGRGISSSSTTSTGSASDVELRSLFNWSSAKNRFGKHRAVSTGRRPSRKKVKVVTWTQTWVCLSGVSDDIVQDATERVTLKLAGLGERRFALDCNATAQEVHDTVSKSQGCWRV